MAVGKQREEEDPGRECGQMDAGGEEGTTRTCGLGTEVAFADADRGRPSQLIRSGNVRGLLKATSSSCSSKDNDNLSKPLKNGT